MSWTALWIRLLTRIKLRKPLLDVHLELNPAELALNRKWSKGAGKQAVRLSKPYAQLKKDLRATFREERTGATDGPVLVEIRFCGQCDIDAPVKLLLDALTGSVVHDDVQVEYLVIGLERGVSPCLHVRVVPSSS